MDKTGLAIDLIESSGKAFFLSRPRRFGKSLLVDTFKELFEGRQALFDGLAAETRWDWSKRHPVIRISFGGGVLRQAGDLDQHITELIDEHAHRLGLTLHNQSLSGRFKDLIRLAHEQAGASVVVLVDEYDKPILDNLTEPAIAHEMRDGLRNLYSVLKDMDAHLRFVFLTGCRSSARSACSPG